MNSALTAIRHAIRVSRRNTRFVALVAVILGVGIGATTAAVNVAGSVLWNPLPVTDDSRLVLVSKTLRAGSTVVPFSPAEMAAWGEASGTFDAVAGFQYDGAWPWPAQFADRALLVTGTAVRQLFQRGRRTADRREIADGRRCQERGRGSGGHRLRPLEA